MPRDKEKAKVVKLCKQIVLLESAFETYNYDGTTKSNEFIEDMLIIMEAAKYLKYAFPKNSVPKSHDYILPRFNERRFRKLARVNISSFQLIAYLIKNDDGFTRKSQYPVELQLFIVLYRLGASGKAATFDKISALFRIPKGGTIQAMTDRVLNAIIKIKNQYLYWPDAGERERLISETMHELPHCIGYVDATEIELIRMPSKNPDAYSSRKYFYSVKVQAVCDYKLRVRHLVLGHPGRVHDAHIYNNSTLSTKPTDYFCGEEWLAGDSAYTLTSTLITPFRANSTDCSAHERDTFNKAHSKYRGRVENCFEMIKERFTSLKVLRMNISNNDSMRKASRWVLACAILHNISIAQNDLDGFENFFEVRNEPETNEDEALVGQNSAPEGERKRRALVGAIMQQEHL